jgi:hypothetical protein
MDQSRGRRTTAAVTVEGSGYDIQNSFVSSELPCQGLQRDDRTGAGIISNTQPESLMAAAAAGALAAVVYLESRQKLDARSRDGWTYLRSAHSGRARYWPTTKLGFASASAADIVSEQLKKVSQPVVTGLRNVPCVPVVTRA